MSRIAWSRLVQYQGADGVVKYGEPLVAEDQVNEISSLAESQQLKVRVCQGKTALEAVPTEAIEVVNKLLGPLSPSEVPIIRCIGLNYRSHILETGRPLPPYPTIFHKPSFAVADHGETIPIPQIASAQADYEGELVILIGKEGKNISEDDAMAYVAAYTAGNDISARDWQRDKDKAGPIPQWSFSKSFDKYAPLGPCLVSADILGEADKQDLRVSVNGEQRQAGNTSDLCFGVRKLVAFCSQGQTLQKGSLIMTGTPGGVGLFMTPSTFLRDGDVVEVEIDGIGTLRNRIAI